MARVLLMVALLAPFSLHAQGVSGLLGSVAAVRPALDRIASASRADFMVHCLGDSDCADLMQSDAVHLSAALRLLDGVSADLSGNSEALASGHFAGREK